MPQLNTPWIQVYPFNGRDLCIKNSEKRAELREDLSKYCGELWKPKAEKGWKSSWIAFAHGLSFSNDIVSVDAGAMPFAVVDGMNKAIEERRFFAPQEGYVNCLSVGFPTATRDSKIIFQRRASNVHCPNMLIHEPCGYMASMEFAKRSECDMPKFANDPRLFDVREQLEPRRIGIAEKFGVAPEAVSYETKQDVLACGWKTTEMYFSTTGKIDTNESELKKQEKGEFLFVPFEHLKELINNQGRLSRVDPTGYHPEDPREIPLIDESLVGLIWGYEKLTGERLDIAETTDRLSGEGLSIKVHDTSPGRAYNFPSYF